MFYEEHFTLRKNVFSVSIKKDVIAHYWPVQYYGSFLHELVNMQSALSLQEMFAVNITDSFWQNGSCRSNILVTPALKAGPAQTLQLFWLKANSSKPQCTIHLSAVIQWLTYIHFSPNNHQNNQNMHIEKEAWEEDTS